MREDCLPLVFSVDKTLLVGDFVGKEERKKDVTICIWRAWNLVNNNRERIKEHLCAASHAQLGES